MYKKKIIYILLSVTITLLIGTWLFSRTAYLLPYKEVNVLDRPMYQGEAVGRNIDQLEKGQTYTISYDISDLDETNLLIRSSFSEVTVSINRVPFYEHKFFTKYNKPIASLWHVIEIPKGELLEITYHSPYNKFTGLVNPVYYGERGDLLFYIIKNYGYPFIVDILILFFGLLLILLSLFIPEGLKTTSKDLGFFAILIALWLISESKVLQFFSGSQWLLGGLPFLTLALVPIPFLKYVKKILDNVKVLDYLLKMTYINVTVIFLLQIGNILDLYETVIYAHFYIILCIGVVLYYTIKSIKEKNQGAKNFLVSFSILTLFVLIEMFTFYTNTQLVTTYYIRIGLLFFIVMISTQTIIAVIERIRQSYKAEFYKKLAYLDSLTGGPNRTAFNRDLEDIFNHPSKRNDLMLVFIDMNKLKEINDNHGHMIGDEAIQLIYRVLNNYFHRLGQTYRIGGDEFACIIQNSNEIEFFKAKQKVEQQLEALNLKRPYELGVSIGNVIYNPETDSTMKRMLHRADTNMYVEKQSLN